MGTPTDKALAKSIIDQFKKDRKSSKLKNKTQRIEGQILRIPEAVFKGTFQPIFPNITDTQVNKIFDGYIKELETHLQAPFLSGLNEDDKDFYITLREDYKQSSPGMTVLVIRKFRDLNEGWKGFKGGRKEVLAAVVEEHYRAVSDDEKAKMTGADNKHGSQLGHADEGVGLAISQVSVARAKAKIAAINSPKITQLVKNYETEMQVTINHEMVVDSSGNFLKRYVPIITVQSSLYNQEQGREDEKSAFQALERELNEVVLKPGSTSLPEAIAQTTLFSIAKGKGKLKSTGTKKQVIREKSKGTVRSKVKSKIKIMGITESKPNTQVLTANKQKSGRRKRDKFSVTNLLGVINDKLPQTVEKNMGAPRLENRTGRFAGSVRLQDAARTKQGHISFGYTYAKSPYQVFEVGEGSTPWANSNRDPRKIIDKSIREIAANMALGRFYTRRL